MRQALMMFAAIAGAFLFSHATLGYHATFSIAYGALTLMALMISMTFLWLWTERTTPLALGMSFSWAGAASLLAWGWIANIAGNPDAMKENGALFIFIALYFVGAILHFGVMQRSMGLKTGVFAVPVLVAFVIASLIRAVI